MLPFCDTRKVCINILSNAHPAREWVVYGFLACAHQLFTPQPCYSPVTGKFPAQMASNAENVSIWWRHVFLGPWLSFSMSPLFTVLHHPPIPTPPHPYRASEWRSYSFPISFSKELPGVMHQSESLNVHGSISYTVHELINSNLVKYPWLLHENDIPNRSLFYKYYQWDCDGIRSSESILEKCW